jgi:hypothetical protein
MSLQGAYEEQYTLAQLARRVGISESRARAMRAAGGDRLPPPDAIDAGGHPLWRKSTIDRWCRRVGRPVPKGTRDLAAWEDATEPAPVMFSGEVVTRSSWGRPFRVHAIVWDTPNGHLVQLTSFNLEWVDHREAVRAAAQVIEPAFWADAIMIIPPTGSFGEAEYDYYNIDAYRLKLPSGEGRSRERRLLSFLKPPAADEAETLDPAAVLVETAGLYYPAEIERVLGRPMPLWLEGSCTPEAARRQEAFGQGSTFTVPDTTTPWPLVRERLQAAVGWEMTGRFPQAFAVLARDALTTLDEVQAKHAKQGERGQGWYLVARPARPSWDVAIESAARVAAQLETDLDDVATELEGLRPLEATQPYPGALGEALDEATSLLGWLLRDQRPELVYDAAVPSVIELAGPVAEQWHQTLTPIPERERVQLAATRRVARLISPSISPRTEEEFHYVETNREKISGMWRDYAGRLVAELAERSGDGHPLLYVEWSTNLPRGWTDHTVVAADPESGAVVALTPLLDGQMQADLLPNPGAEPSYTWGYSGTGPSNLYDALIRCALGLWRSRSGNDWLNQPPPDGSELWRYVSTTAKDGPIRLPWPQIQAWARSDRKKAMSRVQG